MHRRDLLRVPTISLVGVVGAEMIKTFDTECREIFGSNTKKPERVILVVTTEGGSSDYACGLHERVRLLGQEVDLSVLCLGAVYSAGIDLLLAVPKKQRFTTRDTRFLIHNVQFGSTLQMKGTAKAAKAQLAEVTSYLREAERYISIMFKRIAADMGLSRKEVKRRASKGWYLSGEEAVSLGLVDSLLEEG